MHLKFVELFCDVVQYRSFSKAAAAHNVSQSAASQAVNLLEKHLETKLIDRSVRPFELTPAGAARPNRAARQRPYPLPHPLPERPPCRV